MRAACRNHIDRLRRRRRAQGRAPAHPPGLRRSGELHRRDLHAADRSDEGDDADRDGQQGPGGHDAQRHREGGRGRALQGGEARAAAAGELPVDQDGAVRADPRRGDARDVGRPERRPDALADDPRRRDRRRRRHLPHVADRPGEGAHAVGRVVRLRLRRLRRRLQGRRPHRPLGGLGAQLPALLHRQRRRARDVRRPPARPPGATAPPPPDHRLTARARRPMLSQVRLLQAAAAEARAVRRAALPDARLLRRRLRRGGGVDARRPARRRC